MNIYADGGSMNDRGISSRAWFATRVEGEECISTDCLATSNEAEWKALISALDRATYYNKGIRILIDSKLVYNQVKGTWKVINPRLAELCGLARSLIGICDEMGCTVTLELIPGSTNIAHHDMDDPSIWTGIKDIRQVANMYDNTKVNLELRNEEEPME